MITLNDFLKGNVINFFYFVNQFENEKVSLKLEEEIQENKDLIKE